MNALDWANLILPAKDTREPRAVWADIFVAMHKLAEENLPPNQLNTETIAPDRMLAEAAWELWEAYPDCAEKTADALNIWTQKSTPAHPKAVLILDALSLRELPILLEGAKNHSITPVQVKVTGAECPSDTNAFAKKLGCLRNDFENDHKPQSFIPFSGKCCTDLLKMPFVDCTVPADPNLVLWHTWVDDLIHISQTQKAVERETKEKFLHDDFWSFIDTIRQGRDLLLTSDHGYAITRPFFSQVSERHYVEKLRNLFSAGRYNIGAPQEDTFAIPPLFMHHNGMNVVLGQRKWSVQGRASLFCHGGMTLLEVAVPWIEFPAI